MIIRRARPTDYPAILQLQGENVPEALDERRKRQGFIVSRMNEAQLTAINRGRRWWMRCWRRSPRSRSPGGR